MHVGHGHHFSGKDFDKRVKTVTIGSFQKRETRDDVLALVVVFPAHRVRKSRGVAPGFLDAHHIGSRFLDRLDGFVEIDLSAAVFDVVGHHRNAGRWGFLRGEG